MVSTYLKELGLSGSQELVSEGHVLVELQPNGCFHLEKCRARLTTI